MSLDMVLKEGAWLIADAHFKKEDRSLFDFLSNIPTDDLPSQLILMGDIFDLLFGDAPNSIHGNEEMIECIENIAKKSEVIYLEGNHDFGLQKVFSPAVKVISRSAQPLIMAMNEEKIAMHHGDVLQGVGYEIYTAWIRNLFTDRILNAIDTIFGGVIISWLERYNADKNPCYLIDDFKRRVNERVNAFHEKYNFDWWVEGHFHQDFAYKKNKYINLPSFACSQSIIIVKLSQNGINFQHKKAHDGSKK